MTSTRRILLYSAIGIVIYLVLSLYHGHQLKKLPRLANEGVKTMSSRAQEKNWVQVTTDGNQPKSSDAQVQRREQYLTADPAGREQAVPSDSGDQQERLNQTGEEITLRLTAMQRELQQVQKQLAGQERGTAQNSLKTSPADGTNKPSASAPEQEEIEQLVDIDQLRAELAEARTSAAIAAEELNQARLKADAMFKYGQEQNRRLAPMMAENKILKARLQETGAKLLQAEQHIMELNARVMHQEKELGAGDDATRNEPGTNSGTGPAGSATAAPAPGD